jgi:putative ABC transport system permease protein
MGWLLLVYRLTVKDLRHRPIQAFLLVLAIAAGAATLTLGLAVHGTTDSPYARTRDATNGPDVVATVLTGGAAPGPNTITKPGDSPSNEAQASAEAQAAALLPLQNAPGVVASSGPFPVTWTVLGHGTTVGSAEVEGRDSASSSVDQPKLLTGSWVQPGDVVVEAGFASTLGIHVDDHLGLGGKDFRVVGIAVTAAIPAYPNTCSTAEGCILTNGVAAHNPGLVWAIQADAMNIAGPGGPDAYFLNLKLTDPGTAQAFVDHHNVGDSPTAPYLLTWQQIRDGNAQTLAKVRTVLTAGSWLLGLLAIASVVVLVGGRMAEQTRRVGLLKAIGGGPRLVVVVLLVEHLLVGLCAAAAGLLTGWLAAPLIDEPSAGLLGASGAPSITWGTVAAALALTVGVSITATLVPAIRAARQSTVSALNDSARSPRRHATIARLTSHLPATLLIGIRLAARRPRRLLLTVFSIGITVSGLVAVLIINTGLADQPLGPGVAHAITIISAMLIVLAAVNALFIAWSTVLDTRHAAALTRALGASPHQITTGLSAAQMPPTLIGALLGIPGGILLYNLPKTGPDPTPLPSALSLAALVIATLLVVAVLTALPNQLGAQRRTVAEMLEANNT